ncbi:MAG: TetR/AcrR family transcriptional regulator [Planctomycetes bacterium]|nr:TetR/AcrR family transcriptional regulator [Planctomycetota bacterium]
MARPRKVPNVPATRERVQQAARGVFARVGFAGATLGEIAREVGIRRPSLLHHFATKDALYREVVAGAFGELGAALGAALEHEGDTRARLEALARAFGGFVEAQPEVARLVLREVLADGGPGQAILLEQAAPLLDGVVAFVEAHGLERLAAGVSARGALMAVVSDALLRAAAGPLRGPLWGPPLPDLTWATARALLWTEAP